MTDETPELRDDERGRMDYDPERAKAVLNEVKRRVAEAPRLLSQIADDILQAEFLTARELEDLAAPGRGWSLIGTRNDADVEGPRGFLMVLARVLLHHHEQVDADEAWRAQPPRCVPPMATTGARVRTAVVRRITTTLTARSVIVFFLQIKELADTAGWSDEVRKKLWHDHFGDARPMQVEPAQLAEFLA